METKVNFSNVLKPGDEGYIDIASAVSFSSGESDGCLTVINTTNSKRIKLSKNLLSDIGNPSEIEIKFTDECMLIFESHTDGKAFTIKSGQLIYNTPLTQKVMKMSGKEFPANKSVKIGTYKLQTFDEDKIVAVISFK